MRNVSTAVIVAAVLVAALFCAGAKADDVQEERVRNGGFEEELSAWQWGVSGGAEAAGKRVEEHSHSGFSSFRLASDRGVVQAWVGGWTPGTWDDRNAIPGGDFGWRHLSGSSRRLQTDAGQSVPAEGTG